MQPSSSGSATSAPDSVGPAPSLTPSTEQEQDDRTSAATAILSSMFDSFGWVVCIRSFGRPTVPTLSALSSIFDESEMERVVVLLAWNDPALPSYKEFLQQKRCLFIVGEPGADKIVEFAEKCSPLGSHLVIADDNIMDFKFGLVRTLSSSADNIQIPRLADVIDHAGVVMQRTGKKLWGLAPSAQYLHNGGDIMAYTETLGLVYGAFFGLQVSHDEFFYSKYGGVKDDIERSVRYYHKTGIFRFISFAVIKLDRPGTYKVVGGGNSSQMTKTQHAEQGKVALKSLIDEFAWRYCRLATDPVKPGAMGIVFKPDKEVLKHNMSSADAVSIFTTPSTATPIADVSDCDDLYNPAWTGQIFVKCLSGRTITLNVDASYTTEMIKDYIVSKEGERLNQRLICGGKQLEDLTL